MKNDSDCAEYVRDNLPPNFEYPDFAPQLTMEFFNPELFSHIVAASGAKYIVFTSKHHDGFCNFPSRYSYNWNSVDAGPKRDVIGELKDAFAKNHPDVKFGLYYSLYEWFNPMYLRDKDNHYSTREYVEKKMLPELKQLVTDYAPEVLWSDGDWEASPDYWGSKDILAWLYNESPSKDTVVTNDRWGAGTRQKHGGYYSGPDRYDPGTLQAHKWENAMTVDKRSWGIRRDIFIDDVMQPEELITKIVKAISCGGNILVNVGPTREGTIVPIFQERLMQMGLWLRANGEAIYGTKPWIIQQDIINEKVWYTQKGVYVYAISLEWPDDDVLTVLYAKLQFNPITNLQHCFLRQISAPGVVEGQSKASLLGLKDSDLRISVQDKTVLVEMPSMSKLAKKCGPGCQWAYVVRLEKLSSVVAL